MLPKRVFPNFFAAILHLDPRTINMFSKTLVEDRQMNKVSNTKRGKGQLNTFSFEKSVCKYFLCRYLKKIALTCPTGRGSSNAGPVKILSCQVTKQIVYEKYVQEWNELVPELYESFKGIAIVINRDKSLTKDSFGKVWC